MFEAISLAVLSTTLTGLLIGRAIRIAITAATKSEITERRTVIKIL